MNFSKEMNCEKVLNNSCCSSLSVMVVCMFCSVCVMGLLSWYLKDCCCSCVIEFVECLFFLNLDFASPVVVNL